MRVVRAFFRSFLPIQKQYFNRLWFAFGQQVGESKRVERAWVQGVHPPYFRGTGWALRVGRYSLRVGLGRANSRYIDDEEEASLADFDLELAAIGWHGAAVDKEVIRTWDSSARPETEASE